jgi:hypothetical protein
MTVHARTRWTATAMFVLLAALALIQVGVGTQGFVLAALAVVPILVVQRMRLRADASGVTVVNLLRVHSVEWSEISDFRLGRVALSTCLDVCTRDGTRVHAWAVTATGSAGYPSTQVDSIISDLRQRLMLANGWSQAELDARATDAAVAAADRGDYRQASGLVADGRVGSQVMAEKLLQRSQRKAAQSA